MLVWSWNSMTQVDKHQFYANMKCFFFPSGAMGNASDTGANYLMRNMCPLFLLKYFYAHRLPMGGQNLLCSLLNLSVLGLAGKPHLLETVKFAVSRLRPPLAPPNQCYPPRLWRLGSLIPQGFCDADIPDSSAPWMARFFRMLRLKLLSCAAGGAKIP